MLDALAARQEKILEFAIRNYIETGQPVGSKTLVDQYDLDVSSATVRNDLAALSELGYLTQIHTSGGRIPTEQGYRYFVQKLLGDFRLPFNEQKMIEHQFHQARLEMSQWMRLAAAILARVSMGASFVTAPRYQFSRFKHMQLISTQGRFVLMVLVLHGGDVKQQMLTLAEPVTQAELTVVANRLNTLFVDLSFEEISAKASTLDDALTEDVTKLVLEFLLRSNRQPITDFYRDGLVNIVEDEGTRQAVRVLEERTLLADVLSEMQVTSNGIQVVIGGEGRWEELKDCSIILSRYGVPDQFSGTVAVLGPTRMPYGRNVAAVRYVANLMSGFVYEYYAEAQSANLVE